MDFCRSVSVSGEHSPEQPRSPGCSKFGGLTDNLDDLLAGHKMTQEADVSLEWLSIFVEDCLYDTGHCQLPATQSATTNPVQKANSSQPSELLQNKNQRPPSSSVQKLGISFPGKVRSKRPRRKVRAPLANWAGRAHLKNSPLYFEALQVNMETACDPPLLQQSCWLADSELIAVPKNEALPEGGEEPSKRNNASRASRHQQQRRCSHCLAHRTPQWRAGPLGPKTLCNACGVRYKSGRLLPEYRPAKSPTFVSFKHSNSHKKVMELRNEPERHVIV